MSKIGVDTLSLLTAQNAIILATLANTLVKLGISLWAGSNTLRKNVLIGYGAVLLAGLIGMLLVNT